MKLLTRLAQHNTLLRSTRSSNSITSRLTIFALQSHMLRMGGKTPSPSHALCMTAHGGISAQSNPNLYKRHITHHNSSMSYFLTLFRPRLPKNDVHTYVLVSTHIPFLALNLWHSKCVTLHSLTLNPSCTIHDLLLSLTIVLFHERVKP